MATTFVRRTIEQGALRLEAIAHQRSGWPDAECCCRLWVDALLSKLGERLVNCQHSANKIA